MITLNDIDLDYYKICNEVFVYGSQESKNELLEEFVYSIPELEAEIEEKLNKNKLSEEIQEERLYFAQETISEILKICKSELRSPKQIKDKILRIIEESSFEI